MNSLLELGLEEFVTNHVRTQLDIDFSLSEKEIIVSLNKIDLLNANELALLNERIAAGGKFFTNKITCTNESQEEIDDLLKGLNVKLKNL